MHKMSYKHPDPPSSNLIGNKYICPISSTINISSACGQIKAVCSSLCHRTRVCTKYITFLANPSCQSCTNCFVQLYLYCYVSKFSHYLVICFVSNSTFNSIQCLFSRRDRCNGRRRFNIELRFGLV